MNCVRSNGIDLTFESFGDLTAEPLVLIAGLGSQMIRWTRPFCDGLARRGYRVIRFDNRDAGHSTHLHDCGVPDFAGLSAALKAGERPDVPYTLGDMADDTIGLLDALDIPRAHVVGRSMGGMIAQVMASEHPERVLSLTSIMSCTGNPGLPQAEPDVMALMTGQAPDPLEDREGFLKQRLAFAQRIAGVRCPFDGAAHRALVLEEAERAYDPVGTARQMAAVAAAGDRRARLTTITAPTLVIHGTEDPLFPRACGEDTAAVIPNAELLLLDGLGHELPEPSFPTVTDAIDRIARQRGTSSGLLPGGV